MFSGLFALIGFVGFLILLAINILFLSDENSSIVNKILLFGISGFVVLFFLPFVFNSDGGIKESRIIGKYVVNTNVLPGKNADWQYEHYKLEVTKDKYLVVSFYDKGTLMSKDSVEYTFVKRFVSDRIKILGPSQHHFFQDNPTLYRKGSSFTYRFFSKKYGNVYFRKKKWYEFH